MNNKELLKRLCEVCKENGERLTRNQVKTVLEALKTVSVEACKEGKEVRLRNFIVVKGALTIPRKLPNGTITVPRLKVKAEVSKTFQEDFKHDVLLSEE